MSEVLRATWNRELLACVWQAAAALLMDLTARPRPNLCIDNTLHALWPLTQHIQGASDAAMLKEKVSVVKFYKIQ
jgi:hypothetical protein